MARGSRKVPRSSPWAATRPDRERSDPMARSQMGLSSPLMSNCPCIGLVFTRAMRNGAAVASAGSTRWILDVSPSWLPREASTVNAAPASVASICPSSGRAPFRSRPPAPATLAFRAPDRLAPRPCRPRLALKRPTKSWSSRSRLTLAREALASSAPSSCRQSTSAVPPPRLIWTLAAMPWSPKRSSAGERVRKSARRIRPAPWNVKLLSLPIWLAKPEPATFQGPPVVTPSAEIS